MTKKNYSKFDKEELIRIIAKLESRKKYGLVWDEEKTREQFEEESRSGLPVLHEVKKNREIISKSQELPHVLIEGDNYHSLSVLNYTHENTIDMIYIDPPYNTGNKDFIYNDKYVDKDDGYRHSKWLSFMSKRLRLAKNLLKDTGAIFISIDDNEMSQLKLLLDDIFGSNNFVNTLIVQRRVKSLNTQFKITKSLNQAFEYVLVYRKSDKFFYDNPTKPSSDNRAMGYWNSFWNNADRPTMRYDIEGIKINKGQWKWSKERAMRALDNYKKYCAKHSNIPQKDYWLKNKDAYLKKHGVKLEFIMPTATTVKYWVTPSDTTILDTNLMMYYINDDTGRRKYNFDTTKNVDFIKKLIAIGSPKESIIFDFFAGSGTTGEAVLQLNKEEGCNRQFILCTDNENNICTDICLPRIKNAIKGASTLKTKKKVALGGSLKYFKTSFVKRSLNLDQTKINITSKCTEMLCLKEGIFNLIVNKKDYKIFRHNNRVMAIYYSFLNKSLVDLKERLHKLTGEKILYCFTLDPFGLDKNNFVGWDGVMLEPIPQKILDIYNQLNRY